MHFPVFSEDSALPESVLPIHHSAEVAQLVFTLPFLLTKLSYFS